MANAETSIDDSSHQPPGGSLPPTVAEKFKPNSQSPPGDNDTFQCETREERELLARLPFLRESLEHSGGGGFLCPVCREVVEGEYFMFRLTHLLISKKCKDVIMDLEEGGYIELTKKEKKK